MSRARFRKLPALLLLVTATAGSVWAQGRDLRLTWAKRRALVVGANDYQHVRPLRNAVNDARDLGAKLVELDFDTTIVENPDLRELNMAVDRFVASIEAGDVALFHFSGHGLQHDRENYLIPTDFTLRDPASLLYDSYSASKVHDRLTGAGAGLAILLLDACRNNGFDSSRGAGGLAAMSPAQGSFIAFATGPGSIADDNPDGRNGLFTSVLLETLDAPGLDMLEVFQRVREGVVGRSAGRQTPWTISSVLGRFYFSGEPSMPGGDPEQALEIAFWNSVRGSDDPRMIQTYLDRYPGGAFADLARAELTQRAQPEAGEVRTNPRDGAEYAWIPAGEFSMGCVEGDEACEADEEPRPVRIERGFWVARTETTVGAYKKAEQEAGRAMPPVAGFAANPIPFMPPLSVGHNPNWEDDGRAMTQITWGDAVRYCRETAGGRLPTEQEWEYAARAGARTIYPHGDELTHDDANYGQHNICCGPVRKGQDRWLFAGPVAAFAPNAWGLYDMAGNVWEWTASDLGEGGKKTLRGGAWDSIAAHVRTSDRLGQSPEKVGGYYGFRCVVDELPE